MAPKELLVLLNKFLAKSLKLFLNLNFIKRAKELTRPIGSLERIIMTKSFLLPSVPKIITGRVFKTLFFVISL